MKRRQIILAGAFSLLSACVSRPLPHSAELREREWTSFDGKIMPLTHWPPASGKKPTAILIAVHGLSGAASDFWPLGEHLSRRGLSTYAFELRGQGNDPQTAERGDIRHEKLWQQDLRTFHALLQRRYPRTRLFWYGESLGSLIVMSTAAAQPVQQQPHGILLASPVAGLRMEISSVQRWLLNSAAATLPLARISLGTLAGMDESSIQVTSETTHGEQMAATPHHVSDFTLRLLAAIGRLIDTLPQTAQHLRRPLLMLASPQDVISSPQQITTLFQQIGSRDKKQLWYTRSRHLILHDVQRQEALEDIEAWLHTHRR